MPPKKKGGKKGKGGKKTGGSKGPTIIDGVPVSEMTKEQLEGHVRRLQEEVRVFDYVLLNYKSSSKILQMAYVRLNPLLPSGNDYMISTKNKPR